ncbi:Uncharacterized protein APZ42_029479 [Daphnia magna]|uniref:Uncharacterized protein n=1 Tax=Daphnia magna TaxID=35525 RepID=A0A0P5W8A3_9CRUS|nr:Uncharacterized protein APZ42_029479 [Daphnia magna]
MLPNITGAAGTMEDTVMDMQDMVVDIVEDTVDTDGAANVVRLKKKRLPLIWKLRNITVEDMEAMEVAEAMVLVAIVADTGAMVVLEVMGVIVVLGSTVKTKNQFPKILVQLLLFCFNLFAPRYRCLISLFQDPCNDRLAKIGVL